MLVSLGSDPYKEWCYPDLQIAKCKHFSQQPSSVEPKQIHHSCEHSTSHQPFLLCKNETNLSKQRLLIGWELNSSNLIGEYGIILRRPKVRPFSKRNFMSSFDQVTSANQKTQRVAGQKGTSLLRTLSLRSSHLIAMMLLLLLQWGLYPPRAVKPDKDLDWQKFFNAVVC